MDSNQNRKVRVIAKIKGSACRESESSDGGAPTPPWIKVHKPEGDQSESVTISFGDQSVSRKETFEVDYCYEQSENNELIFSREVKPLISGVFGGRSASVVAYGARSSGKTYLIQGTIEEPGLAVLAMAEILSMATEGGKSIAISFYEVFQDRVFDLLDPKRAEVTVLEAHGKIQLRGIFQVPVKSMEEFQKIYMNSYKLENKMQNELPNRSHRGLIVYVFADTERSDNIPVGKMNFVDLAGYEDSRRKSGEGHNQVENSRINRSIYNLQKVIHALNSNESHVPYRETKLTHMLKDSFGGTNRILMVTCVNPSLCQDSIYMVKLASWSDRVSSILLDSTKKTKSITISVNHSSLKSQIPGTRPSTVKKIAPVICSSQNSQTPGTTKTNTPMVHSSQNSQTSGIMKMKTPVVNSSQNSQTPGTMKKKIYAVNSSQKSQTPVTMKKMIQVVHSSQKSQTPGIMKKTITVVHPSQNNKKILSSSATTLKKKTVPHMPLSAKKPNGTASNMKGRKLFDFAGNLGKLEKTFEKASFTSNDASLSNDNSTTQLPTEESLSNDNSTTELPTEESLSNDNSTTQLPTEEEGISNVEAIDLVKVDDSSTIVLHDSDPSSIVDSSRAALHDIDSDHGKVDDSSMGVLHGSDSIAVEHCEDTTCITKPTSSDEEGQNINKENDTYIINEGGSPPISVRLQELSNSLKLLYTSKPSCTEVSTVSEVSSVSQASYDSVEPKTPEHKMRVDNRWETSNVNCSPWETFSARSSGMKFSLVQEYLKLINTGSKDELRKIKGIGEKRATYILEAREESPEPFKSLDDLKDIGLSAKQIKGLMKTGFEEIFN